MTMVDLNNIRDDYFSGTELGNIQCLTLPHSIDVVINAYYFDGSVQERRNSSVLAMELCILFYLTYPFLVNAATNGITKICEH